LSPQFNIPQVKFGPYIIENLLDNYSTN